MSRHIFSVFWYELKRNFKRRGFLFSTFGLPLLGLAIFFGIQAISGGGSSDDPSSGFEFDLDTLDSAGYVDNSGLFEAPGASSPINGFLKPFETVDEARAALDDGKIDAYYVISEDYMETGDVEMNLPTFSFSLIDSSPMNNLFYSQLIDRVDDSTLSLLADPATYSDVVLERADVENEEVEDVQENGTVTTIFAGLLALSLLTTNGYLMQSIIEEKESRLVEILVSSIRPIQLLIGKIAALGLLGLLQVMFYFTVLIVASTISGDGSNFLSDIEFEADVLALALIYFLVGYLLFAAMFGSVGAIANSITEAPNIAFIFILPAMLPWVFASNIAAEPNGGLAVGLSMFPLTSPMAMVMRASVTNVPLVEIIISLIILSASVVGMLWFAGRLFRVQMLLRGQRPKLRELPGLIFSNA